MPKRNKQYFIQRKQELAEAAMRCFTRKGYHATSIPDICKEADVSIGTLYKHFNGKRDMWMAWYETELDYLQTELTGKGWLEFRDCLVKGSTGLDNVERLHQLASSFEFAAEALRNKEYAEWANVCTEQTQNIVKLELKRLQKAGEISAPLGVEATVRMLPSLMSGAVNQYIWESGVSSRQFEDELSQALDLLVGAKTS